MNQPLRSAPRRRLACLFLGAVILLRQDDFLWRARLPRAWAELEHQLMGARAKTDLGPSERAEEGIAEDKLPPKPPFPLPVERSVAQAISSGGSDVIVHRAAADGASGSPGLQAETSIAVNTGGTVIIAGFNDARGFSQTTASTGRSISGVARSVDGGNTWSPGPAMFGGLPVLPSLPNSAVFGDPDVKYDPRNNRWVYASIYVRSDSLEGMCIHVSNNDGMTWNGPIEVTPTFQMGALADKEFIDINPATGRILMAWTQLGSTVSIRTTYSDDGGTTWSNAQVISAPGLATSAIPRFFAGTRDDNSIVYVVWRTLINNRTVAGLRNVGFARSMDGGTTWSAPQSLTTDFPGEDEILGVDRVNTSPSMAVDQSNGNVYVVYQLNNSRGEGDIAFQRSTDQGVTFLPNPPLMLNGNPGNDRAQFYPDVTVDQVTHRVHVVFYDQSAEPSGDALELMHTYSDGAGAAGTWSPPAPMLGRSFHAGYGNDTSQPNMGDYLMHVARNGTMHVVAAATSMQPRFDEGGPPSPAALLTPDSYYDRLSESTNVAALRIDPVALTEVGCTPGNANGNLDPGETADLIIPLRSYTANTAAGRPTFTGVSATLSSSTPGVTVVPGMDTSSYPNIVGLQVQPNSTPFRISLGAGFVPGTYIDFTLTVTTGQGSIARRFRLPTGTPGATTAVLYEDFDATRGGSLPEFWSSVHQAPVGTTPVPWTTSTTLTPTNAVFHAETGGQVGAGSTKWERLFSPPFTIANPSGIESYVSLDFDIAYSLEDEFTQNVLAYDGLTLRITDATMPDSPRSVLAEAFAETIKTGNLKHFPKHLPRSSDTNYFEDMSVWSGFSNGLQHVAMKFPGVGMRGKRIQLRWEYTEDDNSDCVDAQHPAPCGVAMDNIVMRHVIVSNGSCMRPGADLAIGVGAPELVRRNTNLVNVITVTNIGSQDAANVTVTDETPAGLTFVSNAGSCTSAFPCSLGMVPSGQSLQIKTTYAVPANYIAPNPIRNTASVTSPTFDPDLTNNSASASTVLSDTNADLEVKKTGPLEASPGLSISYTITVTNKGPTDASDVSVADNTPSGLTFDSNSGACTTPFPCNLGVIRLNEMKTITAKYNVPAGYTSPNPIANTATVTSSTPDPDVSNNSATATTPVHLPAPPPSSSGGCGCAASDGFTAAGLAWMLAALARRRRPRSRRA